MNHRLLQVAAFAALVTFSVGAAAWWWSKDDKESVALEDVAPVEWGELVPEGFEPFDPLADMTRAEIDKLFDGSDESNARLAEFDEQVGYAPTVPELDGEQVRIAGYVVPLDFDGNTSLDEFLLVPYYGACIHMPPPPANQVVHAFSESTVELESTWDPVWVIGTIETETIVSNLAESGYRMQLDRVVPWSPENSGR